MALINKLKAIGDAIRAKTGKTDELTLDQMVTEIEGIEGGGSGGDGGWDGHYVTSKEDGVDIGMRSFKNNNYILSVNIPNCDQIHVSAFENANSLKTVTLLKPIEYNSPIAVYGHAFENCKALEEFYGQEVQLLGEGYHFRGCENLRTVYINYPDGRTHTPLTVTAFAFWGCKKLEIINSQLGHLYVDSVLEGGFAECISLEKIHLMNCENIGKDAFWGCTSLVTLILDGNTVCEVSFDALNGTPMLTGEGHIYVPTVMYESYRAGYEAALDQLMPGFFDILFRKIEDYPEICGESAT